MKILLVAKSSRTGGAAIATSRLMDALRAGGLDVNMLVQEGEDIDKGIFSTTHSRLKECLNFLRFVMERLLFLKYERSSQIRFHFSLANTGEDISRNPHVRDADIIHLHWINAGYLSLASLEKLFDLGKPVVWTLHDMWSMTGGCHHALDCENYKQECGNCSYLFKPGDHDLSHRLWKKKKLFMNHKLTFITPSVWMKACVKESSLLRHQDVYAIPNPVDPALFKPANRQLACKNFGLDPTKKYILFGAASVKSLYKGFIYFQEAIELLSRDSKITRDVEIILFGKSKDNLADLFPIKTYCIDFISSEQTIVELYSLAHLFAISSLQDNFPSTVIESLLCGTPVAGFRTGGIPEMIAHLEDGYLAEHKSVTDLAKGMRWILSCESYDSISIQCRKAALKRFSTEQSVKKHIEVYKGLMDKEK